MGKLIKELIFPLMRYALLNGKTTKWLFIKICPNLFHIFLGYILLHEKSRLRKINRICEKKGIIFITIYQTKDNEV